MNDENLIPISRRSPTELREMRKKGGVKSGEARRKKRDEREQMLKMLGYFAPEAFKGKMTENFGNLSPDDMKVGDAMNFAQVGRALAGDTKAYLAVHKIAGTIDETRDLNVNIPNPISIDKATKQSRDVLMEKLNGDDNGV